MIWRCEPITASVPAGPSKHEPGGFTLIELLVVLAILGLGLAIIVGYKPPWSSTLGLRAAAAEIAAGLREARSEAILRNRPVSLEVDLAGRRFQAGSGRIRQLPPELTLALLTVSGEQRNAQTGGIRFNPDGSSTGGRISIGDGRRSIAVGVDWLTGRVSVADAR
jgi:general secretion pathway protein H